jgi:hypothetical protein
MTAARFTGVVSDTVKPGQTNAVLGTKSRDSLNLMRDLIDYCSERKARAYLTTLDQAKAFDRVDHSFMLAVMRHFGFDDSFVLWVALLYRDIGSKIYVNRFTRFFTEWFSVTRSIRQGCAYSLSLVSIF